MDLWFSKCSLFFRINALLVCSLFRSIYIPSHDVSDSLPTIQYAVSIATCMLVACLLGLSTGYITARKRLPIEY